MNKKDTFNRIIVLSIVSIVISSLFNLSMMPEISISAGMLSGILASTLWLKVDSAKQWLIDMIPITLGSQTGWAALLI